MGLDDIGDSAEATNPPKSGEPQSESLTAEDTITDTVDDLLGGDIPPLDVEEKGKPKEVKEKSSKQKTPKQGKKAKPSMIEAAFVSVGETVLESTPVHSEGISEQTPIDAPIVEDLLGDSLP